MTASRPTIYFIRHGETDWNLEGRLQGQQDIPLNDVGRVQAEEAGRRLQALVPHVEDLDYVASPMTRTRETMEILRETLGLHPDAYRLDERLVELTFGVWEGMTWKEVRKAEPQLAALRERTSGTTSRPAAARATPCWSSASARSSTTSPATRWWSPMAASPAPSCRSPAASRSRQAASIDIWQGRVLVIEGRGYRWR